MQKQLLAQAFLKVYVTIGGITAVTSTVYTFGYRKFAPIPPMTVDHALISACMGTMDGIRWPMYYYEKISWILK